MFETPFETPPCLSLHKSDKSMNKLDERLLTFMASLGAWCGGFRLRAGEDAASWR